MLVLVVAAAFVTPLSLRAMNYAVGAGGDGPVATAGPGYLPALELHRERRPFRTQTIDDLRRGQPTWVFIGDSMLGTRIDPVQLGGISSSGDEFVALMASPATGPAYWYLAFKNHVAASGVRPRAVFILFRDTNLTDTMFRLESQYGGGSLDDVALDLEPELDAIVAAGRRTLRARVHSVATRVYDTDIATGWLEPAVRRWFVTARYPDPDERRRFDLLLADRFDLATLRRDVAADFSGENEAADFHRLVPTSVLPLMIGVAKAHDITLCFVRVQRRPLAATPPRQSSNLRRYVQDLQAWLEANGALFHDDWGDPGQPESIYADGDHVRDRRHYTANFRKRLDPLFR